MKSTRQRPHWIEALFLCLIALAIPFSAFSQETKAFQANCLNLLRSDANTFLYIDLSSSLGGVSEEGYIETDIDVEIGFRLRGESGFFLERKLHDPVRADFLSQQNPFFRSYSFQLPPGEYEVVVDLRDRKQNRNHLVVLDYDCSDFSGTGLSDILLVEEMKGVVVSEVLVGEELGGLSDRVRFHVELYGEEAEMLTARAVLYRQSPLVRSADDGEGMQVLQYTSVAQLNEVLQLKEGRATFSDGIDLFEFDPGRYLFEIFLYRDDSLVGEKNCLFELPWKRIKEIFSNLDTSITMMSHVASVESIQALREIPDEDEKLRSFLAFWDLRAEPGLETGSEVLERYYFRIFYANEHFPEDRPGWETDRGRIYTLYGAPDEQQNVEHGGKMFEVWKYEKWRMRFIFAEAGERWTLVHQ